jgi:hypothetical protein
MRSSRLCSKWQAGRVQCIKAAPRDLAGVPQRDISGTLARHDDASTRGCQQPHVIANVFGKRYTPSAFFLGSTSVV